MDATLLAQRLLLGVPANVTLGIRVEHAVDGAATVLLDVAEHLQNVIGSLHASGVAGLVDACGLAAIISALPNPGSVENLLPLGRSAELQFLAPARGLLTARCTLNPDDIAQLSVSAPPLKMRLPAEVTISDHDQNTVSTGTFEWAVRSTER